MPIRYDYELGAHGQKALSDNAKNLFFLMLEGDFPRSMVNELDMSLADVEEVERLLTSHIEAIKVEAGLRDSWFSWKDEFDSCNQYDIYKDYYPRVSTIHYADIDNSYYC